MERREPIGQALAKYQTIGIDTSLFIYHFENHPTYSHLTSELFGAVESGNVKAVTSMITLMEILVKPKMMGDRVAAKEYRFVLETFPNLSLAAINGDVAELAAEFRAKYNLRTPDAIQIGTANLYGAQAFVTNDEKLARVKGIDVLVLKKFTQSS